MKRPNSTSGNTMVYDRRMQTAGIIWTFSLTTDCFSLVGGPVWCSSGDKGARVVRTVATPWAKLPEMSLSPHREAYWSRIRKWVVRYFQIFIVSAVKICKQCLQTDLASGVFVPSPPPGLHSGMGYSPQMKIPGAPLHWARTNFCLLVAVTICSSCMEALKTFSGIVWREATKQC